MRHKSFKVELAFDGVDTVVATISYPDAGVDYTLSCFDGDVVTMGTPDVGSTTGDTLVLTVPDVSGFTGWNTFAATVTAYPAEMVGVNVFVLGSTDPYDSGMIDGWQWDGGAGSTLDVSFEGEPASPTYELTTVDEANGHHSNSNTFGTGPQNMVSNAPLAFAGLTFVAYFTIEVSGIKRMLSAILFPSAYVSNGYHSYPPFPSNRFHTGTEGFVNYGSLSAAGAFTEGSADTDFYIPAATIAALSAPGSYTKRLAALWQWSPEARLCGIYIYHDAVNGLEWRMTDSLGVEHTLNLASLPAPAAGWHHVSFVWTGAGTRIYINQHDQGVFADASGDVGFLRVGGNSFPGSITDYDMWVRTARYVTTTPSVQLRIFAGSRLSWDSEQVTPSSEIVDDGNPPEIDPDFSSITVTDSFLGGNGVTYAWSGLDPASVYQVKTAPPSDHDEYWGLLTYYNGGNGGAFAGYDNPGGVSLPDTQAEVDDPSPGFWEEMLFLIDINSADDVIVDGPYFWDPDTESYAISGGATTLAATSVTRFSAVLNGSANPGGVATDVYFAWGEAADALDNVTAPQSIGAGSVTVPFSASISGLTPGRQYFFEARVV